MPHAYRLVIPLIAISAALVLFSCGDGGSPGEATATFIHPASATPTQTSGLANEGGQAPIFWRTADNFASLTANQPYKVVVRITNSYAEPALSVTGVCTTCRTPNEPPTAALTGVLVTPGAGEAPGSYYPMNVLLPRAGHWELTVHAGADSVTIPVDVAPAP